MGLTTVFGNDELWELEYQAIEKILPTIAYYEKQVTQSAQGLLDTLEFDHELGRRINLIYLYSRLKSDQDTTNETYQSMHLRAQSLFIQLVSATSFITPAILTMDEMVLAQYVESQEGLTLYRHYLKVIHSQKPHKLSNEQGKLLSQMEEIASAPSQIYHVLTNTEVEFPMVTDGSGERVQLTQGIYHVLLESQNRNVRNEAFLAMYETYQKRIQTFASILSSHVKANNKKATIRHYSSARHAAMSQSFIPEKVYDQLLSTIQQHLPLLHRYMALRTQLLGVKSMYLYDVSVPINDKIKLEVSYEDAKKIIVESVAPFGSD
ncbi:M3 family metallopeptidase [Sporosarcina sp. ANT_H38]|uniref:M3 family metallopeptidase n=1 Tax=Sporosarcina sp. ANT_H38 TaxID=2597358 RepID=UPI00210609A7|nr:M3 family metallopeptidase [Sporosarcina sp. ANT_H38]